MTRYITKVNNKCKDYLDIMWLQALNILSCLTNETSFILVYLYGVYTTAHGVVLSFLTLPSDACKMTDTL